MGLTPQLQKPRRRRVHLDEDQMAESTHELRRPLIEHERASLLRINERHAACSRWLVTG